MTAVRAKKPSVFNYRDCGEYLNDLYKFRKRSENSFSYEKWAQEMGLKSRSYLRYLCLGEKLPTASLIPQLLRGLQLTDDEASYFITLVNLASAPNNEVKAIYTKEIFRRWTQKIKQTEITEIIEFLADPIVPQLFTYLSFEDAPTTPDQWAQDLKCSAERIQSALKCLIWQKLVDGQVQENGEIRYQTVSPHFAIPTTAANTHIRAFHLEGIKQAQAAVSASPDTRKMYSAFFALTPEQFARAQELIQDFNKQMLALFDEKSIHGKKLYRLNQQLLSVSGIVEAEGALGGSALARPSV